MRHDRPCAVGVSIAQVTPRTQWIFVEVETAAGMRGVGEATLPGREDAVVDAVSALAPAVLALATTEPDQLTLAPGAELPQAAAHSAVDQALWDIEAQRRGVSLAHALGGARRARVPVYANINRRTHDRSPAGFALSALAAIAAGHDAVKLAPFDDVAPGVAMGALRTGIARIAAVRDAIGPASGLMIDCHWRLDPALAEHAIDAAAAYGAGWIECPLPETAANIPAITRLRAAANRHGMLLAGMETAIGVDGFMSFARAGAYDVMMPDIKYVGGLRGVMRLSSLLDDAGVGFSPHSPSGPICHAISLAVCAAAANVHSLETQFDETPFFAALAGGRLASPRGGTIAVPTDVGIGITLQHGALAPSRSERWTAERIRA